MRYLGVSVALVLAAGMTLGADSLVRIVHVSYLAQQVEVSAPAAPGASRRWAAALLNAPVVEGDSFRTGVGGEAEIQLECGSALRLAPESSFDFTRLRLRSDGVDSTTVAVTAGTAFFNLGTLDSRDFQVSVPGGAVETAFGSSQFQVELPAQPSPSGAVAAVRVSHGRVRVRLAGAVYPLKKSVQLAWSAADKIVRLPQAVGEAGAQWNQERNRDFNQELMQGRSAAAQGAQQRTPPAAPTLVLPSSQPATDAITFPSAPPPSGAGGAIPGCASF